MINDAVVATAQAAAVHRLVGDITDAEAQIAEDDVVRTIGAAGKIRETDAVARRSLAGDGAIRLGDGTRAFQFDEAGNTEDDRPRPFRLHRRPKTAGDHRFALPRVVIL